MRESRTCALVVATLLACSAASTQAEAPEAQRRLLVHDDRVKEVLARLTLEERVGQTA